MIRQATLRLQSSTLSGDEISERLGRQPSRCFERGSPVSSYRPDGPTHTTTRWHLGTDFAGEDDLNRHVEALSPQLARLATIAASGRVLSCSFVVMVEAVPAGARSTLSPTSLRRLAEAGCSLFVDVWNPFEDESQ